MADESLDDLANAALDGDQNALTAALTNPDLQNLIDRHREVRVRLRQETEPVNSKQRQLHLNAALAAFDEEDFGDRRVTVPDSEPGTVTTLASKRRHQRRWLNVAAAAAVVSVGALAAVGLSSRDTDFDDAATEATADEADGAAATTVPASNRNEDTSASGAAPNVAEAQDEATDLFETGAVGDAADTTQATTAQSTTLAPEAGSADNLEAGEGELPATFPDGPLDPRFVSCVAEFDAPDRPWVTSTVVSDTAAALELFVGDDFQTVFKFSFDPTSCQLLAPAEPIPQE